MNDLSMRDSRIPSRTSQDGNLRDALAAWLNGDDGLWYDRFGLWTQGKRDTRWLVEKVASDPAFRAALTDAIAEAWHDADEVGVTRAGGDCLHAQDAVAIVARLIGDET